MMLSMKLSILLIVLLKSRQFALGEVNMLCEFTTMQEDLRSKKALILHSKMPSELLTNYGTTSPPPERIKNLPHKPAIDLDATPNRQRVAKPNNCNPKLVASLKRPLQAAGSPIFTKIMNFCKKDAYSIFPKLYPVCAPNTFFGTFFFNEKCTKKHTAATDAQVKPILPLLDNFTKYPIKLNAGR